MLHAIDIDGRHLHDCYVDCDYHCKVVFSLGNFNVQPANPQGDTMSILAQSYGLGDRGIRHIADSNYMDTRSRAPAFPRRHRVPRFGTASPHPSDTLPQVFTKGEFMAKPASEQNKALISKAFCTFVNKRDYGAAVGFWSDNYV